MGWEPWAGTDGAPGQAEILDAYVRALRAQHERVEYEAGRLTDDALRWWRPGAVIQNRIRVEAGHTVGKTKIGSGLVNHFFDTHEPAIIYTFAPTWPQIHDLLWKEIKADRAGKGLPGRILDLKLDRAPDYFATGRATNDAGGRGTERIQGQHGPHLMFVLDEAEGVADYVYDAVDAMSSGGIVIVLMFANPRTMVSRFHKAGAHANVVNFRLSCLHHPNVVQGREVVPGAVRRDYVEHMVEQHCEAVEAHDTDTHTFELTWQPGTVYRPDAEFMWRVLGRAPSIADDATIIPLGRYEAATCREAPADADATVATMGVDVARFGSDYGTLYIEHAGQVWRAAQFAQATTMDYAARIRTEAESLVERGAKRLSVRVDGGGGFGGGVVDLVRADVELRKRFERLEVVEVNFNGSPIDDRAYNDTITELTYAAAERLKVLAVNRPPEALAQDLTERRFKWVLRHGQAVKRLEPKDEFRKRINRSPDDGDGFVLAVAPEHLVMGGLPLQWDDDW